MCTGQPGAGQQEKALYRTRDGGKTWRACAAAVTWPRMRVHGGLSTSGYAGAPDFAPNGFGVLAMFRGALYVSRDGGLHWSTVRAAHPEVFAGGEKAFGDGTAYVLLTNTAFRSQKVRTELIETRDFGRTWHIVRRWRGQSL
jgi:photosystem II stability/assembly factor-like uncharacterized protein